MFDEEHAEFFFGRERDVQRLVEKLKATRFLAVLGASGSGKSSLVRAGLIPALRAGALPQSEVWTICVFQTGQPASYQFDRKTAPPLFAKRIHADNTGSDGKR